jgi:hypothetical protein
LWWMCATPRTCYGEKKGTRARKLRVRMIQCITFIV